MNTRTALPLSAADFAAARSRVAGPLHRTPLLSFRSLGPGHWLKCENLQKTGSFKVRGALNAVASLGEAERARGVVTVSAGNHAQAVAWAAGRSAIRAVVVMPAQAARAKVEATRAYGATVVLQGNAADAFAEAHRLARDEGLVFLHPFDAPEVIAGHGSTGLEIAEALDALDGAGAEGDAAQGPAGARRVAAEVAEPVVDAAEQPPGARVHVVVPVGGGGQIAGIAGALDASGRLGGGGWRVWGVEPEGAAGMRRSLDAGRAVTIDAIDTVADGLAAPMAGDLTYRYVRELARDVVVVSDAEIMAAMRLLMMRAKMVVEPSGAAGVAALMCGRVPVRSGERAVAVVTGGNADPEVLARALLWRGVRGGTVPGPADRRTGADRGARPR